jgi:hypothetical protein
MTKLHELSVATTISIDGESPKIIIMDEYKDHIDMWDPIYQSIIDRVEDAATKASMQTEYDAVKDEIETDILKREVQVVSPR